jgi:hypothetical protein
MAGDSKQSGKGKGKWQIEKGRVRKGEEGAAEEKCGLKGAKPDERKYLGRIQRISGQ